MIALSEENALDLRVIVSYLCSKCTTRIVLIPIEKTESLSEVLPLLGLPETKLMTVTLSQHKPELSRKNP